MSEQNLFRKAALDKLASPERLDILMQVIPPQNHLAKWTVNALITATLLWGFFGKTPERIPGQGQLQAGGTQQIQATGEGLLSKLTVAENAVVAVDQLVAQISAVGLVQGTMAAEARYQEAQRQAALVASTEAGQISDLEAKKRVVDGQLRDRKAEMAVKQPLVERGDLAGRVLDEIRTQIEGLQSALTDLNIQIAQRRAAITSAESMVKHALIELQQAKNTVENITQVKSAIAGRITHVYKQQGDHVLKGDVLADVEVTSGDQGLEIIAFVPASYGQRVAAGHPVQITVAGIRLEESGFLKGMVTSVSPALVSSDRVAAVTKDAKSEGASYEVKIAPTPNPTTISGYAWSTGKGPPQKFSGAVPVTIAVEVGERTPISQLVPFLRRVFGA
jgi:HlyD family secretion protein